MVALPSSVPSEVSPKAMPETPNARRTKLRCPKCTAIVLQPATPVFECPICACVLSAKRAYPLPRGLMGETHEKEAVLETADNGFEERSKLQSGAISSMDESASQQGFLSEENRGPLPKDVDTEGQAAAASDKDVHGIPDTDQEKRKLSNNAFVDVENATNESSVVASGSDLMNNDELEDDSVQRSSATNKQWELRLLRTSRCELSFKYSLEGARPAESDTKPKKLEPSKFSSTMPSMDEADVTLQTPLRVRISSRHEESSDHSDPGGYSFSSETVSNDGSESEFDFPAPWANGSQDQGARDSFGGYEPDHRFSEQNASDVPHQLELWDAEDTLSKEQLTTEESGKHLEGSATILPPLGHKYAHNGALSGRENEPTDQHDTSRFNLFSQVSNVTNIMNNATILNNDQKLDKTVASTISLNQQVTPSVSMVQTPFISCKGNVWSLDACDNEQMSLVRISGGQTSHFLRGALTDVRSLDEVNATSSKSQPDSNDNDAFDHLLQDTEQECDLYEHHQISEWKPDLETDLPSGAHSNMENQSNLGVQQLKLRQNGLSDKSASSTLLPDSPPANHEFLKQYKFDASSSEQMYCIHNTAPSFRVPGAFQLHSMNPCSFTSGHSACSLCPHNQFPCMQTHLGPCCLTSARIWNSGHSGQWSCFQSLYDPGTGVMSSVVPYTPGSANLHHSHGFSSREIQSQARITSIRSPYPPLPKDRSAPYVLCKGCGNVLQVPLNFTFQNSIVQKLRCSVCGQVNKYSVKQQVDITRQGLHDSWLEKSSTVGDSKNQHLVQHNPVSLRQSHDQRVDMALVRQSKDTSSNTEFSNDRHVLIPRSMGLALSSQGRDYIPVHLSSLAVDGSFSIAHGAVENPSGISSLISQEGKVSGLTDTIDVRQESSAVSVINETVDEKDEGLDFGAPRISDGESLDPTESRMRSPENFEITHTHNRVAEVELLTDLSEEKQRGAPLLVLLNQESTRFSFSLDPRPLGESASWSPASDIQLPKFLRKIEQRSAQSGKGRKFIAGLLRRSIRDFSKSRE